MLEVNITKKLHDFTLRAEFDLPEGVMGLMGSSGSGKSMTLKCIAGIVTPDAGRIVLGEKVLFDSELGINLPPQERRIGYLFQSYALFPNMTALENVCCGLLAKGMEQKEARKRAEELLETFKLPEVAGCYPRRLSGGQRQRVALARMLAAEPEVLLLDEPFAALDEELKEELQGELRNLLHSYGKPAIIVSHSRHEIAYMSDYTARLVDGILQEPCL